MTSKTTYTCNLCHKSIEPSGYSEANGFALCWDVSSAYELQQISDWTLAPIHLCRKCIRAMSNAASKLDAQKLL